ncbi:Hypothetical protein ETEE_1825 [Edwardsiella anguillarum ET080813]|uniref:Uncharacterized protein n=1 Tax=Edwardsiella anguillarum ET080813 TaxID=667120 RepID=A0A076LNI2_9GAMM|nr:Hypothetical protein ETEE_1825 [Edwardsiella anguillarum ET080813]
MARFYHNPFSLADPATTEKSLRKTAQFLSASFDSVYLYS